MRKLGIERVDENEGAVRADRRGRPAPQSRTRPHLGHGPAWLIAEWHPERNGTLGPNDVGSGSSRRVWWRCGAGHEWEGSVRGRTNGTRCPYCTGRRPSPERNLAACFPAIAAEWHPERNRPLRPDDVVPASARVAWWRGACGHEWQMGVSARTRRPRSCPLCPSRRPSAPATGTGDVAHRLLRNQFPGVAAEWHPTRNARPTRPDLMAKGQSSVWWLCRFCGEEWRATVADRAGGSECRVCSGSRHRLVADALATALVRTLPIGDRMDLPRLLRSSRAAAPDVVLPTLRLGIDVHLPDEGHFDRARDDPRRAAAFAAGRWRIVRVREASRPPRAADPSEVVVCDLADSAAVVTALGPHLSARSSHPTFAKTVHDSIDKRSTS
ncbi:MAG: hypothetical protein JWN46_977 [Acidimicrobiales bacterium]|nr:hypothetical protein [Acidimicrobiales bacterium]